VQQQVSKRDRLPVSRAGVEVPADGVADIEAIGNCVRVVLRNCMASFAKP
jgi:hypothetical protein